MSSGTLEVRNGQARSSGANDGPQGGAEAGGITEPVADLGAFQHPLAVPRVALDVEPRRLRLRAQRDFP